jgi:F0F1-type ATP synthase gamma subunit
MLSLINLKKDKELIESLRGVIDVLKGFAGTQLHALQAQGFDRSFTENIETAFRLLNLQFVVHSFLKETQGLPRAIVVLTPDEGFTGELTSLLIREAELLSQGSDEWIVLGERGRLLLQGRHQKFTEFTREKEREFTYADAKNITSYFIKRYLQKKVGRVDIIYPSFVSITKQTIVTLKLLPFHPYKIIKSVEFPLRDIIIEPNLSRIVGTLIHLWLVQRIREIFWEARLAQAAARIIQLEGSSQELSIMGNKLRFQYFKLLHSINDRKIREILASRLKPVE